MKRILILIIMLISLTAQAQQALNWGAKPVVSPEINADGTVTFRYQDPKALRVQVTGEFLPEREVSFERDGKTHKYNVPGVAELKEGEHGVWEYTTEFPVPSEMYNYTFIVNGQKMIDPRNMWVNRDVASLTSILLVGGGLADDYFVQDVPHGTVSKLWYDSAVAGCDRRMTVYTPAGYETSGRTRYPVLYVLHGMGGDEEAWVTQGRACQILDNLIASGRAKPMIAVFTNGNIACEAAPLENSKGYDVPTMSLPKTMEGSFETSFPEVVKFIDTRYRTIAKKASRAICGLSMGGFHSLYISLNNPDMFDYVGLFSSAVGVTDPSVSPVYQDLDAKLAVQFGKGGASRGGAASLASTGAASLASTGSGKAVSGAGKGQTKAPALYFIAIGSNDFLYKANTDFRARLDAAGYPYEYLETDGGHIWRNWRKYLDTFAQKIFK